MVFTSTITALSCFTTVITASSLSGLDEEYLERSGLLMPSSTPHLPPYNWPDGVSFSGVFRDHAVLQRAPQSAGVYGVVISSTGGFVQSSLSVKVTLTPASPGITNSDPVSVQAGHIDVVNSTYARWKAVLPPIDGGTTQYTLAASCVSCGNASSSIAPQSKLNDIVFGDVFICSGQSNMWLPVHFSYSRNATFDKWIAGKYRHIRLANMPRNALPDKPGPGYDLHIAPPTPIGGNFGAIEGGGWQLSDVGMYPCKNLSLQECSPCRGGDEWFNNTIDQFSAACWYFAETLTDMAEAAGEPEMPLGLIESNWGGTMVEHWQPNASLNSQVCKNASGAPYAASQLNRWDIDAGSLWNGMILPLVNMTIKGALWYQGENNVFQCQGGRNAPLGDPTACGDVKESSGYGCFMQNLISTWRTTFSEGPLSNNTTPSDFPFGLVSLAGGTSEGFSANMGSFRLSQAGGTGLLPNERPGWENTFVAQAFDLGEPGDGTASDQNVFDGQGPYASKRGAAPHTSFFMGGIHPRPKRAVGVRLAMAARHLVYGDHSIPYTGPVVTGCSLSSNSIKLTFDASFLSGDAVAVRSAFQQASFPLDKLFQASPDAVPTILALAASLYGGPNDFLYSSPLEVQYGGSNLTDGVWVSAKLNTQCANAGLSNAPGGNVTGNKACGINTTTGEPLDNFNIVTATLPFGSANVTGIRYAFRDDPCCPGVDRGVAPCPPASCPIQAYNSTLPAVPFVAKISNGNCTWISITP